MIIQFCGLSGSGKTTLARATCILLKKQNVPVEIIDGDEYRGTLCRGLGFSKEDRCENVRRMAFVAGKLSGHGIVSIICAINPYEQMRQEIRSTYRYVKTVFIDCPIDMLKARDTKGLYRRAYLPDDDPDKLKNLTGVNDPFEVPADPDLTVNTHLETITTGASRISQLIMDSFSKVKFLYPKYPGRHIYPAANL